MKSTILGISAFYHDSAAALIRDGNIVAAAQEERFTRKKHDPGFPRQAIQYCIREAGIDASQIDHVAFYERPMVKFERLLETYRSYAPEGFESYRSAIPLWIDQKLRLPEIIGSELGVGFAGRLWFLDHHHSHAASAFFPSPYEEAAILTLDAVGEWGTSSIGKGSGNRIKLEKEQRFPHSLGMLYTAFTYYTGFRVNSGEYKLMGLAPYGEPKYADTILEHLVEAYEDGSIRLDMAYFNYCQGLTMTSEKFHNLFGGPPRDPESVIAQKDMDLAASVQLVCEEVVLKAARHVHELTDSKRLVMAGGVALNCVANGRIVREGPFEDIWVQPAAGDAGGALGAALFVWHQVLDQDRVVSHTDSQSGSLLGPRFDDGDTELLLDALYARYEYLSDEDELLNRVARILAEEKVVGWFSGRMEYGPRALGNRSIIGDPRSARMQQTMNLKIKFRESFRPFAPSVLKEHADELFDLGAQDSPYMLLVGPVRDEWRTQLSEEDREKLKDPDLRVRVSVPRSTVPAITHVDYSARVQTVDAERHGRYYKLIKKFYDLTGCPALVNTSFNIRGEPMVCTPEDAYRCFMATDMDYLVIDNFLLEKNVQPQGLLPGIEQYKELQPLD